MRTRPLLVIDGDCGFCSAWAERIGQWLNDGGPRDVDIRPSATLELTTLGLTPARVAAEVVLVMPSGATHGGAQALARWLIWREGGWSGVGRLLTLPGVRQLAALSYRAVAANRYRLPGPKTFSAG